MKEYNLKIISDGVGGVWFDLDYHHAEGVTCLARFNLAIGRDLITQLVASIIHQHQLDQRPRQPVNPLHLPTQARAGGRPAPVSPKQFIEELAAGDLSGWQVTEEKITFTPDQLAALPKTPRPRDEDY